MIDCTGLTRTYRMGGSPKVALDAIDFQVDRGETRCLLGPNGAGKTSLVRILSTVLVPTSGVARIDGYDVVEQAARVRRIVRLNLGGESGFYRGLTVRDNVRYWATMYGLGMREAKRESDRVLDLVGMGDEQKTKVDALSRGMKQRVHLARSLLGRAELLLLDEPTTGMDPVSAAAFRDLVRSLKDEGVTILLTTHDMEEAEDLADRITLINHGTIETTDTSARLRRELSRLNRIIVSSPLPAELRSQLSTTPGIEIRDDGARGVLVVSEAELQPTLQRLVSAGVTELRSEPPSLQDVYLALFGHRGMAV